MLVGYETARAVQQRKTRGISEMKSRWLKEGKNLDYYARRRKEMEKQLFIGGRGF